MAKYIYHVEIATSEHWLQEALSKWGGAGYRCVVAKPLEDRKGNVSGPHRGTFTASGQWDVYLSTILGQHDYGFDEKFTIKIAGKSLTGKANWNGDAGASCESFGPNHAKWHTENQQPKQAGSLAIPIIESGHLKETFK